MNKQKMKNPIFLIFFLSMIYYVASYSVGSERISAKSKTFKKNQFF